MKITEIIMLSKTLVDTAERKNEKIIPPEINPINSHIYAFPNQPRYFFKRFLFENPKIKPTVNAIGAMEIKAKTADDFNEIPLVISVFVSKFMLLINTNDSASKTARIKNNVMSFLF